MTNDHDKRRELKRARKTFIREHGREPTEMELQVKLGPIPLQVDMRSRSTALTIVEPPEETPKSEDWHSAPWDRDNPLFLMELATQVFKSGKPHARIGSLHLFLMALLRSHRSACTPEQAVTLMLWCAECSGVNAGRRSPWFEPVRREGEKPDKSAITHALWWSTLLAVLAAECWYRTQRADQRSWPAAFGQMLADIQNRIQIPIEDAFPAEGDGNEQPRKHKREAPARGATREGLVRRFDKKIRPKLAKGISVPESVAQVYQIETKNIANLDVTGLRSTYNAYLEAAANGLEKSASAYERRIRERKTPKKTRKLPALKKRLSTG